MDGAVQIPFRAPVRSWFETHLGEATEPQKKGWPAIGEGHDVLIAAPTGSGKTLAAFLWCLDDLIGRAERDALEAETIVLYISPLKALSNDVQKNLRRPLETIEQAEGRSYGIDVAVRTGDTTARDRARMAKTPPHVLVTTPESLYILLTSGKGRDALASVQTVIVDEIHAIADDKRGAHLALSLERLDALVKERGSRRPQRIGLSATQKPIETVGHLLVGGARPAPTIVDAGFLREADLAIEVPTDELGAVATHEMMGELHDRIAALTESHRTTIVFVNTRRLVERVAHALAERIGEDRVAAHHGSLSKETRLDAEQRLKSGALACIVATASLELGIDVGEVDLVVQVGSPRSIATFLQRVGRSGHCLGATPKGRLYALTRDQLMECAALIRAVNRGILDALEIPTAPLDILAQQMVAICVNETLSEDELFERIRGAYHYRSLARDRFDAVLTMLADGIVSGKGRQRSYLHRDRINGTVGARRNARLVAITSGGAIPDNGNYAVIAEPDEKFIGTLDEDFAIESSAGDVFLLGNTSWRIRRVESGRVRVVDAHGMAPNVPFWRGEAPARTPELSEEVSSLRADLEARFERGAADEAIAQWLAAEVSMPTRAAEQVVDYLAITRNMLGAIPTKTTIVAERFFDEAGGMQLVLHAPLGARLNRAWGLALRKKFCRSFNFELQAAATDDGVLISLGPVHSFPLETVFSFVALNGLRHVLEQAVLQSPLFGVRWRWAAQRSLAVPRFSGGKKVPAPLMRMRTDDLLTGVFPMAVACQDNISGPIEVPDHPLVDEAMRDCLEGAMDIEGLRGLIAGIESNRIQVLARDTAEPSPLGHELINANPYAFLDDAPLEERRARAVSMRRGLPRDLADDMGRLDASAIADVAARARPIVRDPDELHDALHALVALPAEDGVAWTAWFDTLVASNRASCFVVDSKRFWIASEQREAARAALGDGALDPALPPLPFDAELLTTEAARVRLLRANLETSGPCTADAVAQRFGLAIGDVDFTLLALEAEGAILRGRFTPGLGVQEWCDRRILARIHRQTVGRLRREIEPVTPADFMRFLFSWQHVADGARLHGLGGAMQVVAQLQGFHAAAPAWEDEILPARLADFDPSCLDSLCLGGEVAWGRLSLRDGGDGKVVTRAARITIVSRDALPWMLAEVEGDEAEAVPSLTTTAREVYTHLTKKGASFSRDLVHATASSSIEIEEALRELVYTGLVTADGFAALRSLLGRSVDRAQRPMYVPRFGRSTTGTRAPAVGGRWTRLRHDVRPETDRLAVVGQLLLRYGVVFRDLLKREPNLPPWRDLLVVLRRLEARGEIRGGRFVSGFVGEQYALPEAVDALRAMRRDNRTQTVRITGTDPLNLVGIVTPGPKVPAVPGNVVLFRDGIPLASREGGRIVRRGLAPHEAVDDTLLVTGALQATT